MIDKAYSKKRKKYLWGFDERFEDGAGGKRRKRIYTFETKREAEEMLAALRRQEYEAKFGITPMISRPLLHDLIAKRLPTLAEDDEQTRARRVLYTWLSLLDSRLRLDENHEPINGYRSSVKVDEIDMPKIRDYVDRRLADGLSASSINRELNIIGATLHKAEEFFSELKQWKAPRIPRLKEGKSRREKVITDNEYNRLVAHLHRPPDSSDGKRPQDWPRAYRARVRVAQIFEFAMLTAARHGEIVQLKWSDVDWERRKVLIFQGKTGDYKEVPLVRPLAAVLEARKPASGRFVFTRSGNIYPKFYKILKKACEAVGIPYGRDMEDGLVLHSARHTVTTRLVEAGLDYDTIGLITGHRAKELIAHYAHKHPGSVARAAEALEKMSQQRVDGQNVDKNESGSQ
jgi:integrase